MDTVSSVLLNDATTVVLVGFELTSSRLCGGYPISYKGDVPAPRESTVHMNILHVHHIAFSQCSTLALMLYIQYNTLLYFLTTLYRLVFLRAQQGSTLPPVLFIRYINENVFSGNLIICQLEFHRAQH